MKTLAKFVDFGPYFTCRSIDKQTPPPPTEPESEELPVCWETEAYGAERRSTERDLCLCILTRFRSESSVHILTFEGNVATNEWTR